MITVTRLGGQELLVNADLIEFVEPTPDTIITLTTGKKIVVRETPQEVTERVIRYRCAIARTPFRSRPEDSEPPAREEQDP